MKKKYSFKDINLQEVHVEDITTLCDPWAFKILLLLEAHNEDTEIMMENMLDYFLKQEEYEYAIVVRDLTNGRKEKSQS